MIHNEPHHSNDISRDIGAELNNAKFSQGPFDEILKREVTFRAVSSELDRAADSFIETYRQAFGGAPYYEQFEATFVKEHVWKRHQEQLLMVAEERGDVIGLLCAHRVTEASISPSACGFITDSIGPVIDQRGMLYFSELAVRPDAQGLGIGSALVAGALSWAAERYYSKFILRTAESGSNSSGIFKKFGAKELSLIQEVQSAEADGPSSSSNSRIYLGGDVVWQGDYLTRIKHLIDRTVMTPPERFCHS
jgi:GNAT superfamily N-acetyltransferase